LRSVTYLVLDGEGVLEAVHALFQILDLALLLRQRFSIRSSRIVSLSSKAVRLALVAVLSKPS
jgi:hypothetical protein